MFLQGFILGFSIAAPVGPIGLLCIQRTLRRGRLTGFVSGLGAATADALYGLVAALGLSIIMRPLLGAAFWIQLGGAGYLAWLGVQTLRQPAAAPGATAASARGLTAAFVSIFLLTLANPATILSFLAAFAGLPAATRAVDSIGLVTGVFLGSAAWWLILSFLTGLFRERLDARSFAWISRLAGIGLIAFALWILKSLLPR